MSSPLKKFLINSISMYANQGLIVGLSLLVSLKVIGHLGPSNFGIYSTVLAFASLFSMFTTGSGIDSIIIAETANASSKERNQDEYLSTGLILRVILGVISFFIAILVANILNFDRTTFWLILLFSTSLIFSFDPRRSILTLEYIVKDRRLIPELVIFLITILALGARYSLAVMGSPLLPFVVVQLLQILVLSSVFLVMALALGHFRIKLKWFRWTIAKNLLIKSLPLAGSSLMVMIYLRIDQIMLSKMLGMESVGIYSVAVRIVESINFFPTIAAALFLPIVARHQGSEKMSALLAVTFRMATWGALLFVAFFTLFGRDILFFLWGDQYLASVKPLEILIWSQVVVFISCMHGPVFIAYNLQRYIPFFTGITALLNVVLNLLLIPRFGPSGAAIATTATYGVGYVLVWFFKELRFIARPTWIEMTPLVLIVAALLLKWPGLPAPNPLIVMPVLAVVSIFIGIWSYRQVIALSASAEGTGS